MDRAVPMWGKSEDGNASAKALNTTLLSEIAQRLARYGVQPGASIDMADAALVTEDNLTTLGKTLFITRLPATSGEGGRVLEEALAHHQWEKVGVLAQTKPTKHHPGTAYKVAEAVVTCYGMSYRAVVVHSRSQEHRRQKRLDREVQAAQARLEATVRGAAKPEYCCQADAEVAAAQLRTLPSVYHQVDVEEIPQRGQRAVGAVVWAVIVSTLLRWLTAVISHSGKD